MAAKTQSVSVSQKKGGSGVSAESPERETNPLINLREEIDKVFDRYSHGWPWVSPYFQSLRDLNPFKDIHVPLGLSQMALSPRLDVAESDDGYEVTAELPGMTEKDIEVTVADGGLTLKGEKKDERDTKKKDYHLTERSYGAFRRVLRIPQGVDSSKISASFRDGVLKVVIPKSKEAKKKQRKVDIRAS